MNEFKNMDIRVGSIIKDTAGEEWVVGRIFEHEKHFDLALTHKETRRSGELRVQKTK